MAVRAGGCTSPPSLPERIVEAGPALVTIIPARRPRGVMATSGGWAYCQQVRALARRTRYTLLCGKYAKDRYAGRGLRELRHLDWGNPAYLRSLASTIQEVHREIGGPLVIVGVSYSGFGVAALASHHPELRPDRLIIVDSYLDLIARRRHSPDGSLIATEIDNETGGSEAELRRRSVLVDGLVELVRSETELVPIWTISDEERRLFRGATCDRTASAGVDRRARTPPQSRGGSLDHRHRARPRSVGPRSRDHARQLSGRADRVPAVRRDPSRCRLLGSPENG